MSLYGVELAIVLDLVDQHYRLLDTIFLWALYSSAPEIPQQCLQLQDHLYILVDPYIYVLVAPHDLYGEASRFIVWFRISSRLDDGPDVNLFRYSHINPHRHFRLDYVIWRGLPRNVQESLPLNSGTSYGLPEWLKQGCLYPYIHLQYGQQYSSLISALSLEVRCHFPPYLPASLDAAIDFLLRLSRLETSILQPDAIITIAWVETMMPLRGVCKYCHMVRKFNSVAAGTRMTTCDHDCIEQRLAGVRRVFVHAWGLLYDTEAKAWYWVHRCTNQPAWLIVHDMLELLVAFLDPDNNSGDENTSARGRPVAPEPLGDARLPLKDLKNIDLCERQGAPLQQPGVLNNGGVPSKRATREESPLHIRGRKLETIR
ncbi:hypothetical protein F4775DRAFT_536743 [Biscogniauxia sp. FL1348]|nr:hypothetical protein F4775DRAFT_536743 [Biscogniauxia sp. FL1348]